MIGSALRSGLVAAAVLLCVVGSAPARAVSDSTRVGGSLQTSIKHVVILFQENHSFDELLGGICVQDSRCDAATSGLRSDGTVMQLLPAPDISPFVAHNGSDQTKAIDGGKMDKFDRIAGCGAKYAYACYTQYAPEQIPNLAALARAFVISDRTFEDGPMPSWGAHLDLVAAQLDGFVASGPGAFAPQGDGQGCDSGLDTAWREAPQSDPIMVPACVPKPDGSGPYRPSPVPWIPTIMDRLQGAGLSWRIYAPPKGDYQYGKAVCPVFADCLYTRQAKHLRVPDQVIDDAAAGKLPRFSVVIPYHGDSQHNGTSVLKGDNWIGSVVGAIMNGPQWGSTAVLITYDDCGCFYDHVPPPSSNLGIRVPMVIVSPYAKPGFTDSSPAQFASMLSFTERAFGLAPLATADANAYDYSGAFDFAQAPLRPFRLQQRELPAAERAWLREHPPPDDAT